LGFYRLTGGHRLCHGLRATEVRALWGSTNGEDGGQCINSGPPESRTSRFDCRFETRDIPLAGELLFGLTASYVITEYKDPFPLGCVYKLAIPDLLVTIDFSKLSIPSDSVNHTPPRNSVQVRVGLTNDTSKTVLRTSPTTLIPGVNLVGIVNVVVRQVTTSSVLSFIGFKVRIRLFSQISSEWFPCSKIQETFLISEMVNVWPDPWATTESALIPRAPHIATIRLIPQFPPRESEWRVIQDHPDKSLLRGVSSGGGLWTALSGILAFLFGSSIIRTMFGK